METVYSDRQITRSLNHQMNRSLVTQRRVLIAVTLLLLVNGVYGRVGAGVAGVVEWVSNPFGVFSPSGGAFHEDPPVHMEEDKLAVRYAEALVLIDQLQQRVTEQEGTIAELRNARSIASFEGVQIIEAGVTRFNQSAKNPILKIDQGTRRGIGPRMTVIWRSSMVGLVLEEGLTGGTAKVQLITRAGAEFKVRIKSATPDAVPYQRDEFVKLGKDRESFYVDVPVDQPVRAGDLVHMADERYPPSAMGRIIGKVTEVKRGVPDIRLSRVIVRPTLRLTDLPRVEVLVPVTEDPQPTGGPQP